MMANYMKSEWYRITRSKTVYLFILVLAGATLAMNLLLFTVNRTDADFPYATVSFSLSNLVAMIPALFAFAGLLAALLYAEDFKRGSLKNALMQGMPRGQLFIAKSLMSALAGIAAMAFILFIYMGSAALLLEGPAVEPVRVTLEGMAAALPTLIAVIVLAIACLHLFNNSLGALTLWASVIFVVPLILNALGLYFEPVAHAANWLPTNFFQNEVAAGRSGFDCLWETPSGLMKCLAAGGGSMLLFTALGLRRTEKMEL